MITTSATRPPWIASVTAIPRTCARPAGTGSRDTSPPMSGPRATACIPSDVFLISLAMPSLTRGLRLRSCGNGQLRGKLRFAGIDGLRHHQKLGNSSLFRDRHDLDHGAVGEVLVRV